MQTDNRGPSAGAAAGQGKSPTICSRLQAAFHARPAFRPLLRLTGRPQDGGGATMGGAPATTHGGAPPPVLLPAHAPAPYTAGKTPKATAPVALPAVPGKPAAAKGMDKPAGKVPASAPNTVRETANKVTEKVSGWMPAPAPAKGGDKPGKVPASAPTTLSATANKVTEKVAGWMPAPAKGGDKPAGKVPASGPTTVSTTAHKVTEKVAGWMPVPAPPSAVTTGRPSANGKAEDKAQQTKGKTRVSSRVRKALASSK
ncbi:unnamed protein product [Alopecurus aequalis]